METDFFIGLSNWGIAIGIFLTAVGGIGNYHFNRLKEKEKDTESKKVRQDLNGRIDELISNQQSLQTQLDPFVKYAKEIYPDTDVDQALALLKKDIEQQNMRLEQANKKVEQLEGEVNSTKEMVAPVKLSFSDYKQVKLDNVYQLIVFFEASKNAPLGELIFNVRIKENSDNAKILKIEPKPELGDFYILGPYQHRISPDGKRATLKYKPAGVVNRPNFLIELSDKTILSVSGNYEIEPIEIKM